MNYDYDESPLHKLLGMSLVHASGGRATVEARVRDEFRNIYGVVHGAIITALLDSSAVQAVRSQCEPETTFSTINIDVSFMRPAKTDLLTSVAHVRHLGGRTALADAEIRDEGGLIAGARVLVHIRRSEAS